MSKLYVLAVTFLIAFLLFSCSKKHHPGRTLTDDSEKNNNVRIAKKNDSLLAKKTAFKPTLKDIIPEVIVVNDNVARKSVDGRYYYDLLGHRYWRNNKDGKYYLFNKSMYTNDAFKKPD